MLDLIHLESRFLIKHQTLVLLVVGFFAFGMIINFQEIGVGMEMLNLNSPYRMAFFIGLTSQLAVLCAAIFASVIVLRDSESRLDQVIGYLSARAKTFSQFFTTLAVTLGLVSLISIGLSLSTYIAPQKFAPDMATYYLWPWLIFVLPNTFLAVVFVFSLSYRFRQSLAVYVGCILLFSMGWIALLMTQAPIFGASLPTLSPPIHQAIALLDPFGLVAFFKQTQIWTPIQKNTQLVSLSDTLLINRIIWIGLPLAWAWIWRNLSWAPRPAQASPVQKVCQETGTMPPIEQGEVQSPKQLNMVMTYASFEVHQLFSSRALQFFMFIWPVLIAMGLTMVMGTFDDFSGLYPTTSAIISYAMESFPSISLAGVLIFSTTILWRERQVKVHDILSATPLSNGTILFGKLLCMGLFISAMIVLLIVTSVGFQVSMGYTAMDLPHQLSLFYYFGLPIFLKSIFIILIHTLVMKSRFAHPLLGLLLSTIGLVIFHVISTVEGVHPLFHFNQFPNLLRLHSQWMGYGMWASQFHAYALLWVSVGLLLMTLTYRLWPRRDKEPVSRVVNIAIPTLFVISGLIAGNLYDDMGPLITQSDQLNAKASYERRFKQFARDEVPQYVDMSLGFDFYPEEQRYAVNAQCTITTNETLDHILVISKKKLQTLQIEDATTTTQHEGPFFNVYLIEFQNPFSAGMKRQMTYSLAHQSQAFEVDGGIVEDGSYVLQSDFEPLLGYANMLEIKDAHQRALRNLPPRIEEDDRGKFIGVKRGFQATLSTNSPQTPITSGRLLEEWHAKGRNYARYESERDIYPMVAYFSGEYAVHRETIQGTPLVIYVHPKHAANIKEMVRATRATLNYCTTAFGPYIYDTLRIIEVPGYHPFGGKAAAGIVALSEDLFIQNYADGSPINNVARNTAYEVIHQWWSEKLVPKLTKGQGVLTESITKYLEAVVINELEGQEMAQTLMQYNYRRYMAGRAVTWKPEVSLLESQNERYLCYGKGPVVFMQLANLIGEAKLNDSLRSFLEIYQDNMDGTLQGLVNHLCQRHPSLETRIRAFFSDVASLEMEATFSQP